MQLGSLTSEHEDIRRRLEFESIAYRRMYSLWLRSNNVSESGRLRLYNDIVLPTLFLHLRDVGSDKGIAGQTWFNLSVPVTVTSGYWYPQIISNADLYERTKSVPVSKIVDTRRLRMASNTLRMDKDTPHQIAVKSYFNRNQISPRGRPRLTLATALSSQLSDYGLKFKTAPHLEHCRVLAANKVEWKNLVKKWTLCCYGL